MKMVLARGDAGGEKEGAAGGGEPLYDRMSRFNYAVTQKQVELFREIGAKFELRRIAETGEQKGRRVEAIQGLAALEDKEAIPILEEIARSDPEKEVRDEAGNAILKLKGESREFVEKQGIEELDIRAIIGEPIDLSGPAAIQEDDFPEFEIPDEGVKGRLEGNMRRINIAEFLKGDEGRLYLVIEYALEGNAPLRMMAVEALMESNSPEALANIQLILAGQDESKMTEEEIGAKREIQKRLTLRELRYGNHSKKDEVVKMLFHDKDADSKRAAFDALMEYKDPKGTAEGERAIEDVLLYLRNMDDEARLGKEERELKKYMLGELDKIRDPRYLDTFIEVLKSSGNPEIIELLVTAMYFYGEKRAIEALEHTANRSDIDEDSRKNARNAAVLLGYRKD